LTDLNHVDKLIRSIGSKPQAGTIRHGGGLIATDVWYHGRAFSNREMEARMIVITCRRCGSINLRKNGRTATGQQKFHCKDCNAYGTLDTKDQERAHKRATVEKLALARLSQRAIARTTGMRRMTVAAILNKSPDTDRPNDPAAG